MKGTPKRSWNCYRRSTDSKMQNAFAFSLSQQERQHMSHSSAHNVQCHPREGGSPKADNKLREGSGNFFYLKMQKSFKYDPVWLQIRRGRGKVVGKNLASA